VLEADGGTLFLDELDEVPAETQVKLLDLIQEKRIRPVGADSFQTIDCRVIAASNRPIEEVLASGKLRRDLYHRIAHSVIELPPLRDRKEDIPALARNVLRQMCDDEEMNVFDLEDGAVRLLQTNPWPGNVRELQAVVQNAAYRARFKGRAAITEDDLRSVVRSPADPHPGIGTLNEQVHQFKLRLVTEALARCNGNQLQAARELGIDRGTLRRLMEK
jgi:transcriptional regulator with PAS, ATPase and Fis domain